jgi:hypothetical protein
VFLKQPVVTFMCYRTGGQKSSSHHCNIMHFLKAYLLHLTIIIHLYTEKIVFLPLLEGT